MGLGTNEPPQRVFDERSERDFTRPGLHLGRAKDLVIDGHGDAHGAQATDSPELSPGLPGSRTGRVMVEVGVVVVW